MPVQKTDTAVKYANQVIALVQELRNMRAAVAEIVKVNADVPLGNLWNALNTTALAADGGIGTADTPGTPVNGHTIDTRLYPGLTRACTNLDLANALQILVDLNTFCSGTQVNANGSRPAQIDNVAM